MIVRSVKEVLVVIGNAVRAVIDVVVVAVPSHAIVNVAVVEIVEEADHAIGDDRDLVRVSVVDRPGIAAETVVHDLVRVL